MDKCPTCERPYGKRKRCYFCQATRRRTGETRRCAQCGAEFYAAAWQLADTDRRQGTYCSKACKYQALKSIRPPWAKPEEKTRHSAGYVLVWKPDHPRAHGGRVFEHILVMEEHLGRPLADGEFVHHEDGCRTNNAASNLRVVTNPEHGTIHARTNPYCQPRDRRTLSCQECGIEFEVQRHKAEPKDSADRRKYCSLACRHRSWGRQMKAKREAKKETNHASH